MSEAEKPRIDFIGIGVNKCGTSWITESLKEHPDVCFSSIKETNFFRKNFFCGWAWYANLFAHCGNNFAIRGEFSPGYLQDRKALERIVAYYPEAKLIVAIRNPIDRLRSKWKFDYGRGIHNITSFSEWVDQVSDYDLNKGNYGKQLEGLFDLVPRQNVHIVLYDDIKNQPGTAIQNVYRFLGIEQSFKPSIMTTPVRAALASQPKLRWLNNIIFFLRKNLLKLSWLRRVIKKMRINSVVTWLLRQNRTTNKDLPTLNTSIATKQQAKLQAYYSDDVRLLSKLTNLDLEQQWDFRR